MATLRDSRSAHSPFASLLLLFAVAFILPVSSLAETGTFIDRQRAGDIRVVSYNVLFETIFPAVNPSQAAKFERVVNALDADVLNLQEIREHTAGDVVDLLNGIAPLGGGATWYAHQGDDNVIASKYPLVMTATNTSPPKDGTALALVDLPDDIYGADLYFMNNHFTCCSNTGPFDPEDPLDDREEARQGQADALVNWMRDARTPGESITLDTRTPMLVVGDLNIVNEPNVYDPLGTLIGGDIFFNSFYGVDSPPDWDGTPLADAQPLHNGTGVNDYTWRNDGSNFDPGRLDYILYTDSVLRTGNQFVLNTVAMSAVERTATGLQEFDITVDQSGVNYDHLPLVTDFRLIVDQAAAGDYNGNGLVDAADYSVWLNSLGSTVNLAADGNGNGIVDADDYDHWKSSFSAALAAGIGQSAIPEPGCLALLFVLVLTSVAVCSRRVQ